MLFSEKYIEEIFLIKFEKKKHAALLRFVYGIILPKPYLIRFRRYFLNTYSQKTSWGYFFGRDESLDACLSVMD